MLDLFSDATRRNPYPVYDALRSRAPVFHFPPSDLWLILDYEGVKRALVDHDTFSSNLANAAGHGNPGEWFIFFDPPRHTKLRALIAKAFTPRVVADLEVRIRDLSRRLLDATIERGEMDLAVDFAVPLPMRVIAELLGVPAADWPRYKRWSDGILKIANTVSPDEAAQTIEEYRAVTGEMRAVLPEWIAQRRLTPTPLPSREMGRGEGDDLLTRLVEAEVDGERLTEAELLGFVQLLLVGGQETTANLINNAILCFLEYPEQLARLRALPKLLPSAIEEVLRYRSPLQWMPRATRREVTLHGQVIPASKLVLPLIGSANRDPAQFRDADRFDITRTPNPHLAFGTGVHACLGAPLARLEARIALTDFLSRIADFALASDAPWPPRTAFGVLGPSRLPIRFTPARDLPRTVADEAASARQT